MEAWSDVIVRTCLSASLVVAQALVVNWLGTPFAAITFFSGVAAYATGIALQTGVVAGIPLVGFGALVFVAFVALAEYLPDDRYLLLTLAALGITRGLAGAVPRLGGQLGMASAWDALPAQAAERFVPFVVPVFLIAVGLVSLLRFSEVGFAVDIARIARGYRPAAALVSTDMVRLGVLGGAVLLALIVGVLQGLYSGRVDPDVFRIDNAVLLLLITLAAGRHPLRMTIVAVGFFVFSDLFARFFGYQRASLAYVRDMAWCVGIVIMAGIGAGSGAFARPTTEPRSSRGPGLVRS